MPRYKRPGIFSDIFSSISDAFRRIISTPGHIEQGLESILESTERGAEQALKRGVIGTARSVGNMERRAEQALWKGIVKAFDDDTPSANLQNIKEPKPQNQEKGKRAPSHQQAAQSDNRSTSETTEVSAQEATSQATMQPLAAKDANGEDLRVGDRLRIVVKDANGETQILVREITGQDNHGNILTTDNGTLSQDRINKSKVFRINDRDIAGNQLHEGDAIYIIQDGHYDIGIVKSINLEFDRKRPSAHLGGIVISTPGSHSDIALNTKSDIESLNILSTGQAYKGSKNFPPLVIEAEMPEEISEAFANDKSRRGWSGFFSDHNTSAYDDTGNKYYMRGPGVEHLANTLSYPIYETREGEKFIVIPARDYGMVTDELSRHGKQKLTELGAVSIETSIPEPSIAVDSPNSSTRQSHSNGINMRGVTLNVIPSNNLFSNDDSEDLSSLDNGFQMEDCDNYIMLTGENMLEALRDIGIHKRELAKLSASGRAQVAIKGIRSEELAYVLADKGYTVFQFSQQSEENARQQENEQTSTIHR